MTKGEKTDERARTEEKYKALVETAADAIFTLDLLGRFTFANLTAERISGYSKEELVGRHFRELLPQEHIPVYLNMFQKALRGQPTPPIEIEMITKGGEKVPLELLGTPIKRGRRVVEIIGMARDITGRKRAEEAYRAVVDHSLQGLIIIQDFRMVFANQAFAEISGYTIEELLSLSPEKVQALVHPEDQALVWGRFQERLAGKPVPQRYEYRGFRKDGAVRWLEMFASPIEYHGKPAVQAAIIDITERKQAEEETQRNYDIQTTLNALLHTSLLDISLEDQLERVLNHILSIPWLALESRGGIFLVEDEPEVLVMKAQRGLATPLQTACARLPFGQCLCGRAALTREMQFADCINDRHETRYEGIAPHGHYCVPILFAGKVLGVINMYVKEGHRRDQREEEFLTAVANTLAGMIKRKRAEEALRAEKALMDALTDNIPDSIYFKDRQCRLTRINRMMMRSLGLKEMSQALGKTDIDLFGEEFGRETLAQDQYIMTTGEPIIGLIESRRLEDGQINWTSTTKVPLRDTSGQIVGLVGVTREINEVKQAEEEVQKRLREITALHRVSEVINATLDLKEVFQRVVEELSSTFGYRLVGLYLVEGEGLRLQAQVGYDSETAPDFIPLERGVVGRAARTGQPAFIRDVSQDPDYVASHPEITCEICIPVMSGGTILGALNVESDEKRPLIDDDLQLLSILSSHIGVAIENARLYEAQQQKSTQLTRILEVGNALRLNLELDQLLEKIAQAVRESMGFNLVVVHVLSEDGQSSVLRALAGYPPEARQKLLGANMPMSIVKPFVQERFKISRSYFVSHEHGLLDESVEEFTYIPGPGELSPGQWHPEDVLLVPLETKEGKSVGYLSADAPLDGKIPSLETIQILEIFANQAAIAIENARLFAERERRVKELSALHDVSLEVVAKTNLSEVLPTIVQNATQLLDAHAGGIYLYRPETRELELTISHGYSKDLRGIRLALGEGLAGTIAQNKQPLIVDDYSHWVGRSPQWEEEQLKGALGVPLMRGDQLLGVLYLDRKRAGTFDERDLQLATLFANQAAIAIENARLYEDARKRIDELSGLYDISQAFSSMADVGETFGELTKRMAQLIGCQVCFIATYDQQAREMHAEPPGYGLSDELVRSLHYKVDGPARESWNFRLQGPLLANDITQIPGFFSWWTQHHGLFNLLIVPLSVESRITGLVYAANKPIGFTQDDTRFLTMFANQAAIVVENARLYDETQKRLAETTLLHKVAEIINATLDLKEIFRRVVEELSTAFGYRLVDIYLLEEDGLRLQANVGYDDKTTIELIPLERGVIGRVARTMEPAFVRDVSQDPDYIPAYSEIKSEICVPIRSGETLLGVLNVECDECRLLREDDLMLLDTLSSHIGVAIENARLYAKTQTHLKAMTTLQKIGAEITSSLDLSTLLQGIADSTLKLTNADYVHIFTLDPDSGEFNQRAASWQPKAKMPPITWPRKNKGLTAAVLKAQDPVIIERATDSPIYATPESRKWGVKSVAGFPLKGKWGLTGVLNMVFLQPHTFSKDELQLLALLADQGAIAIENARLYEETQKRLAETTVLHKVAEVINSTLDLKEVLQRVVEELSATFDYPLLGIYLLENGGLRLGAQIGYDLESESEFIPLDRGIVGRVARTGQPAFLRDVKEDPDYIPDDPKATGEICVPIKWGGEVLGVLNLESTGQRPLTEDDYQLLLTLSSHIGVAIENARLYEETKTLSITDGLTGLYNLRYFYEALEKEIARSGRYSRPLSLIILDIDGFKGYNDTYGHLAGDDLLKELARLMQKTTRNTDIVARYGGEEFVIIQPETGMEGAISLAHRIWDAVREHPFRIRQTQTVAKITISLGLATYPEHGTTAKELVQAADTALLRAKAAGKDRVCSYSEESA